MRITFSLVGNHAPANDLRTADPLARWSAEKGRVEGRVASPAEFVSNWSKLRKRARASSPTPSYIFRSDVDLLECALACAHASSGPPGSTKARCPARDCKPFLSASHRCLFSALRKKAGARGR